MANQVLLIYGVLFAIGAILITAGNLVRRVDGPGRRQMWVKYFTYLVISGSVLGSAFVHRAAFSLLMTLVLIVCLRELLLVTGGLLVWGAGLGGLLPVSAIWGEGVFHAVFGLSLLTVLLVPLFSTDYRATLDAASSTIVALSYVGFFGAHAVLLAGLENFFGHIVFFYMLVLVNDAMALLWGRLLGKNKIWPLLSPNKTYAGSVAALGWTVLTGYFMRFAEPGWSFAHVLVASAWIAVVGQLGDVVASAFKRRAGVKDFGTLLPTFGGMLDRFDAFIFAAPGFYYFVQWASRS